jgi:hypothetical protein
MKTSTWFGLPLMLLTGVFSVLPTRAVAAADSPTTSAPAGRNQVTELIKQLGEEDPSRQQKAVTALLELGASVRPRLEAALKSEDGDLSDAQRERINAILIDDGEIIRLEKKSGLAEEELEALQTLRTTPLSGNSRYKVQQELRDIASQAEMTDDSLALIVHSLLFQLPQRTDSGSERGFDSYAALDIFRRILDHANAGQATGRAFNRWVREWYIPFMSPKEGERQNLRSTGQEGQIVKRLLNRDALDVVTFEQLFDAFCRKLAVVQAGYTSDELRAEPLVMISLVYSRHTTSEHLGRLIQALIAQSVSSDDSRGRFPSASESLKILIASPKLTDVQARAIVTWLLRPSPGFRGPGPAEIDLLSQLTDHTVLTAEDFKGDFTKLMMGKPLQIAMERWRAWWDANRDKPFPVRPKEPRYRYVTADVLISEDDKPAVAIAGDIILEPGIGYPLRKAGSDRVTWVCRQSASMTDLYRPTSSLMAKLMPNAVALAEYTLYEGGGYGGGAGTYTAGAVQFSGWSSSPGGQRAAAQTFVVPNSSQLARAARADEATSRPSAPARTARATFLHDLAQGPGPTPDQLADPSFWINGVVKSAADATRRANTAEVREFAMGRGYGELAGVLQLEQYRMPSLEPALGELLKDSDPAVAASAALVLARWKVEVDAKRLLELLEVEDDVASGWAAEALALAGRPEGVRHLLKHLQDPRCSSDAHGTLIRLADSGRFSPEVKSKLAVEIISTLVPRKDDPVRPALMEVLLAQRWTGEDFGYQLGADPAKNTAALGRYHQWDGKKQTGSGE